ncbi:hypothetical protein TNIN_12701 [Trichonephila inaurata madagascariensis]|uniref:Uncharacterized protein n=1 Tax=Trichonephila inaurata madagascariensis TaxID=2747483 RepID=A0A8X6IJP9_9ARAC|nr:hypothetical protein TNIN_12701 [Trichonephila inaurata madagascariensis]
MRRLIAVTLDNPNRNVVETGSNNRWNNQAYGSVHRGTDPRHRFQSRGYHGQQHQHHHMVRFNGGNNSTVNLGNLCNRIDIIFARPEIMKKCPEARMTTNN